MNMTEATRPPVRYLYWVPSEEFGNAKTRLREAGFHLSETLLTPCQVLRATDDKVMVAPPAVWSRICVRQGSWYRASERKGKYMLMCTRRLPAELDAYLDAELVPTDFQPESLPNEVELQELVDSDGYREKKPHSWEGIGFKDAAIFKTLFTVTRFWGRGDNLKKHWLGHRANHANFVEPKFTTQLDGEEVPYSVTKNDGVCSSCAEFFNVISPDTRKLVRSCPGAVTFGGAEREVYLDIVPLGRGRSARPERQGT